MVRSPKSAPRAPRYPYRSNPPLYSERTGEAGELILDAVSGAYFPVIYAVEGPYGLVDGRNGDVVDLDWDEHQMQVTMKGPMRPPRT